jgi:hypothetical protein
MCWSPQSAPATGGLECGAERLDGTQIDASRVLVRREVVDEREVDDAVGRGGAGTQAVAVAAALDAAGALPQGHHESVRQRRTVIATNAELQGRGLIKLASRAPAMADALRQRGVTGLAARLTAEAGTPSSGLHLVPQSHAKVAKVSAATGSGCSLAGRHTNPRSPYEPEVDTPAEGYIG